MWSDLQSHGTAESQLVLVPKCRWPFVEPQSWGCTLTYDLRLIYMGLGGGLPLDVWHARPTDVWICPDVHGQAPSYG